MKHESACISSKFNHRRAKKDISEAFEQLASSKNICEAHKVFLQITIIVCLSQIGVSSKDDCDKLKSKRIKDSYNTRRSKQNSYHVMNKNIAPSNITDTWYKKVGVPSRASQA